MNKDDETVSVMVEITKGSRNERWFEAKMTGPLVGMCSRPIRDSRQYRCANGWKNARVSQ